MDEDFESEVDRVYAALNELKEQLLQLSERLDSLESSQAAPTGTDQADSVGEAFTRFGERLDALEARQSALAAGVGAARSEASSLASGAAGRDFTCGRLQCSEIRLVNALGTALIVVGTGTDGNAAITVHDREGAERIRVLAKASGACLEINDAAGKSRALLDVNETSSSLALCCGDEPSRSIKLTAEMFDTRITLHQCNGAERVALYVGGAPDWRSGMTVHSGTDFSDRQYERIALCVESASPENPDGDRARLVMRGAPSGTSIKASAMEQGVQLHLFDCDAVPRIGLEIVDGVAMAEVRDPRDATRLVALSPAEEDVAGLHLFDGQGSHRAWALVSDDEVDLGTSKPADPPPQPPHDASES